MAENAVPKKNVAYTFYVALVSTASRPSLQANPTLAAGDVQASTDGAAFGNLGTLPVVTPASGEAVKVDLSASEMNGDNVTVKFIDASGGEWDDLFIEIRPATRKLEDLAWPTTTGRSLDVAATGEAGLDFGNATGSITGGELGVGAFATAAITADAIASNAIGSAEMATDAISAAVLSQAAVDKIIGAVSGTADSGTTTTLVDAAALTQGDTDYWKGSYLLMTSGTLDGQVRLISGFNPAADELTVDPAFTAAVATHTYTILKTAFSAADVEAWRGSQPNNLDGFDVQASIAQMSQTVIDAINYELQGTADSGTTTTLVDAAALTQADDYWNGSLLEITDGTLAGQVRPIVDFDSVSNTLTVSPPFTVAVGTHTYGISHAATASSNVTAMAADTITASAYAAGAIEADAFATDAISATAIAANAIGSSELATDAIGDAQIATGAIASTAFAAGAIDAAAIGTGAIDADAIAANAIGASELAADAVTEIRDGVTGGAYALDTDANGRVRIVDGTGAGELDTSLGKVLIQGTINDLDTLENVSLAAINTEVDTALSDIQLDHLLHVADASTTTTNSIIAKLASSDGIFAGFSAATDSLEAIRDGGDASWTTAVGFSTLTAANINTEVVDVIRTDTATELAAVPAASPDLHSMVQWVYQQMRNERTSTSSASTVANDAGSAIGTSANTDDATTFTRGKFA